MLQENQNARDQVNANDRAADQGKAPQNQSPALKHMWAMFNRADDDYEMVRATVVALQTHPEWRNEIFTWLHQQTEFKLGNSFVDRVLLQLGNPGAPAAKMNDKNREEVQRDWVKDNPDAGMKPHESGSTTTTAPAPTAESKPASAPEAAPAPAPPVAESAAAAASTPAPPIAESKPAAAPEAAPVPALPVAETKSPQAVPAPPANEAAPKPEDKSEIEKSKDEKPEDKQGMVKITASALRIRDAGNLKGKVIGKIPRGGKAEVIGRQDVWLHVNFGGLIGYIHSKYTTSLKGNESGEEEEEHQGEESHEQKQERPKAPPMVNDEQDQTVRV